MHIHTHIYIYISISIVGWSDFTLKGNKYIICTQHLDLLSILEVTVTTFDWKGQPSCFPLKRSPSQNCLWYIYSVNQDATFFKTQLFFWRGISSFRVATFLLDSVWVLQATLDPQIFVKFLAKHQISRTLTTPSLLVPWPAGVRIGRIGQVYIICTHNPAICECPLFGGFKAPIQGRFQNQWKCQRVPDAILDRGSEAILTIPQKRRYLGMFSYFTSWVAGFFQTRMAPPKSGMGCKSYCW